VAVDIVKLHGLVDRLATENAEAVAAKEGLTTAQTAADDANSAVTVATEAYVRETDESKAVMTEIIAELDAALEE